ncbi:hypothetical protein SK571_16625 [Lentzea sp. BCCO 10_0798]|uniref:Uncharacterized protein n=1 Tax=Lentzea kristufekii TaxID=3095430 RepID=A0ABU4TSE9_9PSEU|nr:hypothetical protein [Lentzea sp. BCCO 10_0798]MDX8051013.1 hypothetical protein [Lentzea sp. BCCO 10_0798]
MNLSDLTEVLRERAEITDSAHEARMAGVRARVSATRRRRAVAGAAGVVLVLIGIVFALLPRIEQPGPAVPPRSLPEYQDGARLVAQAWGDLPSTSTTLRFVPKSLDLVLFTHCETGRGDGMLTTLVVNGHPYTERDGCGGSRRVRDWGVFDVVVGQPSVITLTVEPRRTTAKGTFAVGIGEVVPVSEYSFPPRPQTLATFPASQPEPAIVLRPDPAAPAGQREFTIEWPGDNLMELRSNTPGRIRVLVNDVVVLDYSHWSYSVGTSWLQPTDWKKTDGLDLAKGQAVKITVIPERVTGDWEVTLAPR